jgi:hypothetical protein
MGLARNLPEEDGAAKATAVRQMPHLQGQGVQRETLGLQHAKKKKNEKTSS